MKIYILLYNQEHNGYFLYEHVCMQHNTTTELKKVGFHSLIYNLQQLHLITILCQQITLNTVGS